MKTEQTPLKSGFGFNTTAAEIVKGLNLQGKTVLVTGGNSGIGVETTRALANAGASVFIGARDLKKAQENVSSIKNVTILPLDLADPKSIDAFAEKFLSTNSKLDILINNAGMMQSALARDSRGYEMQFATNHLGHFQLTARLWSALKKGQNPRVVSLSSFGHAYGKIDLDDPNFNDQPFDKMLAYGRSKTANSLFAIELDERGQAFGIRAFAVHPGPILTGLIRDVSDEDLKPWGVTRENGVAKGPEGAFKTAEQGAATSVWCAVSPQLNGKGGVYCANCDIAKLVSEDDPDHDGVRAWALDTDDAEALWELSEDLTNIAWPE